MNITVTILGAIAVVIGIVIIVAVIRFISRRHKPQQ